MTLDRGKHGLPRSAQPLEREDVPTDDRAPDLGHAAASPRRSHSKPEDLRAHDRFQPARHDPP